MLTGRISRLLDIEGQPVRPGSLRHVTGNFPLDEAIVRMLPQDYVLESAEAFADSGFSLTGRIHGRLGLSNGGVKDFFIKCGIGQAARVMLEGEFESLMAISATVPNSNLVPTVLGWGNFDRPITHSPPSPSSSTSSEEEEEDIYFLIEDFLVFDTASRIPNPDEFASKIAQFHHDSYKRIAGMGPHVFGAPIPTCDGPFPHPTGLHETWPGYFTELLRSRVEISEAKCGPWSALRRAADRVIDKVVPRLLSNLTISPLGEPVGPCLIHGDLWDMNVAMVLVDDDVTAAVPPPDEVVEPTVGLAAAANAVEQKRAQQSAGNTTTTTAATAKGKKRRLVIFDAGSYNAHNEMELGIWRVIYAKELGRKEYRNAYLQRYPPANPVEEFDDRNRLYSLKYNLNWSATEPWNPTTRNIAYNDMCYLIEKYAPPVDGDEGFGKYDPSWDPTVSSLESIMAMAGTVDEDAD